MSTSSTTEKKAKANGATKRGPHVPSLAERLVEIGRDCARRIGPEYRALDHDALLYDKDGPPRS